MDFQKVYEQLNDAQKQAVNQIDGPVLVLAGPGTGKTQLLGARVAHILQETDTLAQNILCLTFTENGALNMRERLSSFIGQDAYNVNIGTYHAFGGELIRRFPEHFGQTRLQNPVDELGQHEIVREIVEKMSFQNPLKQTRHHLGDLISTISEAKRALLTPKDITELAKENLLYLETANPGVARTLQGFVRMPAKSTEAVRLFQVVYDVLRAAIPRKPYSETFTTVGTLATNELQDALEEATAHSSTKPITAWKNTWLAKNARNEFVLDGELQTKRLQALGSVLEEYSQALEEKGLYDFDDMILRSIQALEQHTDFKLTLQEQYQYILLDEFQDTNAAQFRLIQLLTDNPVHEGRPNVMAVGDDDQAIYAFQGAHYSNMIDFYNLYRDTLVVNLTENYRSHQAILETAQNIASQIDGRLHQRFEGMSKQLIAKADHGEPLVLKRHECLSDVAQYAWISEEIERLIQAGTKPSEIAVIAPRHKQLEPLVPHLNHRGIAVRY